jgi:hypothetical protein
MPSGCACCPVQPHPLLCACVFADWAIHRGPISFYTGSSSLRVGGRLFTSPVALRGAHLVDAIVRVAQRPGFRLDCSAGFPEYDLGVHVAGRNGILLHVLFTFVPVTGRVFVLQRAVRRFLGVCRARRARLVAVALCTHPRLGALSPLASLPSELLLERFCGPGCST